MCVPQLLCANSTVDIDGTYVMDIRVGEVCNDTFEICCLLDDIVPAPIASIKTRPILNGCGFPNPGGVGFRITGAKNGESEYGEFPFMVAVLKEEIVDDSKLKGIFQCGGSLIHISVVLTAAHCVHNKKADSLIVRLGKYRSFYFFSS